MKSRCLPFAWLVRGAFAALLLDTSRASERGVDAARSARRKANVATVGLSLGGALLAARTVLWLLDDAEEPADSEGARFELELGARSAALGATLSGAF